MANSTRFARLVFRVAGWYGLIVIVPLYFLESTVARLTPPAITHPEYYYGFAGVTLAWQLVFLLIGSDPVRYRPLMPIAIVEKATFVIASAVLVAIGRVQPAAVVGAVGDLVLGTLFTMAYVRTK